MKAKKKQLMGLLSKVLGGKRLSHSLNVAKLAEKLALKHAPGVAQKAWVAGLLHDHAKKLAPRELIQIASDHDIEVSMLEIEEPSLLHGKVGGVLIKERFGIDDPEIIQAISDHVAGQEKMGILSKILFVADQTSADRDLAGIEELRCIAQEDLELAVLICAQNKLQHVLSQRKALLPTTVRLYNSLLGKN